MSSGNPVIDRIEQELYRGIRRSQRRRRRRGVTVAVAVGFTLLLAAGGIAGVTSGPIDRLLGGGTPLAQRPGSSRIDLRLTDAGGLGWSMTTYVSTQGMVSSTSAPDGLADRLPPAGGQSGFVIADNLLNGPMADDGLDVVRVRSDGRQHYMLSGEVDARAKLVTIELGGERQTATLSSGTVTLPVQVDAGSLTKIGRERAARMPAEVSVRAYAATFTPNLLAGQRIVRGTVEVTLADGTQTTQETARFCIAASCGARPVEVP